MNNTFLNMDEKQGKRPMDRRRVLLVGTGVLLAAILFSIVFVTKTVTAKQNGFRIKRVASIEIQKGDTLWSIASDYITDEYEDVNEYIEEIKFSNGLTSDTIHAGNYIIVPYYTDASN